MKGWRFLVNLELPDSCCGRELGTHGNVSVGIAAVPRAVHTAAALAPAHRLQGW